MFDFLRQRPAARHAAVTPEAAAERARRGAAFLDGADPGWSRRTNADTLRLADGAACVLGQLHGDYRLGLGRARVFDLSSAPGAGRLLAAASPQDLGFQALDGLGDAAEALDYALLTRAWRHEVRRRAPASASAGRPRGRTLHPA